jgi:hypothetical protein
VLILHSWTKEGDCISWQETHSWPSFDMTEPPDPGFSEAAVIGVAAVNRIADTAKIEA